MFYSTGDKDVGLTVLTHRPIAGEPGYFTMLVTPKVEMSKANEIPRDMVLVLDTSGSMRGVKMDQARNALKYCLDNLGSKDHFALIHLRTAATTGPAPVTPTPAPPRTSRPRSAACTPRSATRCWRTSGSRPRTTSTSPKCTPSSCRTFSTAAKWC